MQAKKRIVAAIMFVAVVLIVGCASEPGAEATSASAYALREPAGRDECGRLLNRMEYLNERWRFFYNGVFARSWDSRDPDSTGTEYQRLASLSDEYATLREEHTDKQCWEHAGRHQTIMHPIATEYLLSKMSCMKSPERYGFGSSRYC